MQSKEIVDIVTNALEELKGKDIIVIDVHEKTSVTDFMVIATGTSSRQVKALANNVTEEIKKQGILPLGVEGLENSEWALVDLGQVVVHVMLQETRSFYDLERLWQGAEQSRAKHASDETM